MTAILLILFAYLLGSFPTSVWVGKVFYGIDIRKYGSKNAGATNTFRVLGRPAGFFVFVVDVAKGYLAVWLVHRFVNFDDSWLDSTYQIFAAIAAVFGHVFPIFAGFKGGKGVATSFGTLLALTPDAALLCFAIFFLIWLITKYVSLGSIIAALFYPIIQYFLVPEQDDIILIFSITISSTVILTHNRNIVRLMNGIETKTYLFRSKQENKL
jgi:glycerol-3-phosphate acyltransferase PlsY